MIYGTFVDEVETEIVISNMQVLCNKRPELLSIVSCKLQLDRWPGIDFTHRPWEYAEMISYGFADDTDWLKFTIGSGGFSQEQGIYFGCDGVNVTVYDSNENVIITNPNYYYYYSFEDWKNGTYYIKCTVSPDSCGGGSIDIG